MAVGAIDGTSSGYTDRKWNHRNCLGHRHFHCLHTQVVSDAYGTIRYIVLKDAQQFGLMRQLGTHLIFPEELCLMAGKLDPNRTPVYLRS